MAYIDIRKVAAIPRARKALAQAIADLEVAQAAYEILTAASKAEKEAFETALRARKKKAYNWDSLTKGTQPPFEWTPDHHAMSLPNLEGMLRRLYPPPPGWKWSVDEEFFGCRAMASLVRDSCTGPKKPSDKGVREAREAYQAARAALDADLKVLARRACSGLSMQARGLAEEAWIRDWYKLHPELRDPQAP